MENDFYLNVSKKFGNIVKIGDGLKTSDEFQLTNKKPKYRGSVGKIGTNSKMRNNRAKSMPNIVSNINSDKIKEVDDQPIQKINPDKNKNKTTTKLLTWNEDLEESNSSSKKAELLQRGKNKQRHLTCLTSYRSARQKYSFQYTNPQTEEMTNIQVDSARIRRICEDRLLSQLSLNTKQFIKSRFQEECKPKEKLYDFIDEGYTDTHRMESLSRKTIRLFDLYYTEETNSSTHCIHL